MIMPPNVRAQTQAFMAQDIPALHKAVESMTIEEARYHMDRARASGLWVEPEGGGGDVPVGWATAT